LAERLLAPRQFPARPGLPEYNVETNKATYLLANSVLSKHLTRSAGVPSLQLHET
jgi:hypothetical protein